MKNPISQKAQGFILASQLASYPDEVFVSSFKKLVEESPLQDALTQEGRTFHSLEDDLKELTENKTALEELRSDYIHLFDWGKAVNSLYETEYGAQNKGQALSDIAGFYKAFGLNFGEEGLAKEGIDHIAVELEFYAILLLKESTLRANGNGKGTAVVQDARMKFLRDHLGGFAKTLPERPVIGLHPFYSKVFQGICALVMSECKELSVEPLPLDPRPKGLVASSLSCGVPAQCSGKGG